MKRMHRIRCLALLGMVAWLGLAHAADPQPQLGSVAPDFRLQDQNGKWHELQRS